MRGLEARGISKPRKVLGELNRVVELKEFDFAAV